MWGGRLVFYRAFFGFIFDFLLVPLRFGTLLATIGYIGFLALNILLILAVPAFFDLYVVSEPRVFAEFRDTMFYLDTAFIGDPIVFVSLVFFNLLLANATLTTRLTRSRWRFFYPVHFTPINLREYRVALAGLGYYVSCYSANWVFYELQVDDLILTAARAAGVS